jgi:glycosyltransferase involved in cell wall biosynthesis
VIVGKSHSADYIPTKVNADPLSLVIPGRNCAHTIRPCLEAVVALVEPEDSRLAEIIFVDDGSTDHTAQIVAEYPVSCIQNPGRGPGAARNTGWRAARHPLVWFVDSDCVAEADALDRLLPHLDEPAVGGVSGSYGNLNPDSLLACLIHEEIIERHRRMPRRVDFLATFNVVYRRKVLEEVGGFDERYLKGQDAELSFRVMEAGYELHFEFQSRVGHYHATRWRRYLRTQRQQGYWRVFLHLEHAGHSTGDSYSSLLDHVQPPLAMLSLAAVALVWLPYVRWLPALLLALLLLAQVPLTWRLLRRLRKARYLAFSFMSCVRAYWRGVGMTLGVLKYLMTRGQPRARESLG